MPPPRPVTPPPRPPALAKKLVKAYSSTSLATVLKPV
jgi:hypothetical protein